MVELEGASRPVAVGVGLYFLLLVIGSVGNVPLALVAAQVVFGAIAIGIGAFLARQAGNSRLIAGAAGALIGGGLAQFGWLLSGEQLLNLLASLLVTIGIGLYLFLVWNAPRAGPE